jgi:preprotein translocase subunit SecF
VFHLTRYRYVFFAISGLIIVPGLLALIFWHLNLGIDFTNGTSVDLVFQRNNVTTQQVASVFSKAGAQDVNVYASTNLNSKYKSSQFVFLQFSRPIGTDFTGKITAQLADPKYKLPASTLITPDYTLTVNGKDIGQLVYRFESPVTVDAVKAALATLPQTDAPPDAGATGEPGTASPTAAASATSAPTATAAPTATGTATAAPATSGPAFPVSVGSVTLGGNDLVYQVNTQTDLVNTPQAAGKSVQLPKVLGELQAQFGPVYVQDKQSVGPAVATETTNSAVLAVIVASLAILTYIGIAFRKVGSGWQSVRFGASAVIALLHDALVVLGLWAIFGRLFNFKVDTLFLTAVLTVIGFSVHDTIVVFDRIRENLSRRTAESFDSVVNTSLIQTMSRSLNTSLTVLIVLAAETLFGGASIREFVLALLIGIASGTYSSIFNASMILSVWENREYRTWFRRGPPAKAQPARSRTLAGTRS